MKKFTLYILTAFGLMGLATSCNDFGDVNNDPMNLNPGVVDYKMEFTQVEAQICGSDWDVWRNGCIYTANMIQHTASVDWAYVVFYTWISIVVLIGEDSILVGVQLFVIL